MASFQQYTNKKEGKKWMYKYYSTVDPLTGKKKQSTKRGFSTKKEAQLDAARVESELEKGTFIGSEQNVNFENVYKQWFDTNSSTFKPSTKRAVISKFNKRILPHFAKIKIKDITKSYCQEVVNKISTEIESVENFKMYVNQIFEYAVQMELIHKNPMKGVIIPKNKSHHLAKEDKKNYWNKDELIKFLDIVKENYTIQDYIMFHLLAFTGGRKGEVLALHWNDIDFKNKTISLNKTLFHEANQFSFLTSKTANSRRSISTDDSTISMLKRFRTEQSKGQVLQFNQSTDLIFSRFDNTPLRLAYPNDKLKEIIKQFNLHPITIHGLRHTHASLLFEAGASIKEVQERLGHSDIKMTMNIYTHVTNAVKEKTASRFDEFMKQLN